MTVSCFWSFISTVLIATCCSKVSAFWFLSCPHGDGQGQAGDSCSVFCRCHPRNTCEAGLQKCAAPGLYGERCHATRPCANGLSCHPGIQKCYHVPRRRGEPCVAGHECGSGLSCEPGFQICFHKPRQYDEPCAAGYSCAPGLSCQPGIQRCLHHPRQENERCSAGFPCADGFKCRLCDEPYATCQLAHVPALKEQDYDRPFNKVAFLVTHNSFSNSPKFALWARNQRLSISKQLQDGVRGLMLDIYPGWGKSDVRLCHGSCFWSGSTNLVDALIEIRTFLEKNSREVVTIFFEDYLKNPTILKQAFDQAEVSHYVLRSKDWGSWRGLVDWPSLKDMRRLGRLVVFNNNGMKGFPYTEYNMWYWVRENRFGTVGQNKQECIDRHESRWNAGVSDHWSLVLVNWFSTAANPIEPCLNSFLDIRDKLTTCHARFGFWANFIAVNFYTAGSGGGAFQAVRWLNDQLKNENPTNQLKKSSHIPFPLLGPVNHLRATNRKTKEENEEPKMLWEGTGYGSGFHRLSDMLTGDWISGLNLIDIMKKDRMDKPRKLSFSRAFSSRNASMNNHSHKSNYVKYKSNSRKKLSHFIEATFHNHDNHLNQSIMINTIGQRLRIANRRKHFNDGNSTGSRKYQEHHTNEGSTALSHFKNSRKKKNKMEIQAKKYREKLGQGTDHPKFTVYPTSRFHPSIQRLRTGVRRKNPTAKIRNLQRQLARIRAKLNRYLHMNQLHRQKEKPTISTPILKVQQKQKKIKRI